jgi:hypothetical protein
MASVLQRPQWNSQMGQVGENLKGIEQWFLHQGVPQFVYGYSPRNSIPVLFYLLLIVVAFNLAIQPWASLDAWYLLIAPAVLVALVLTLWLLVKVMILDQARYLVRMSYGEQISYLISHPIQLLKLFVGVYLAGCLILLGDDIFWSDYIIDFVVIAGLLWSSMRLFRPDAWEGRHATLQKRQRLYLIVAAAVVAFAFEGSVLPEATVLVSGTLGSMVPAAAPAPQASAALLVTVIIAVQAYRLTPGSSELSRDIAWQRVNVFFPAVPLLVLVLCAETAILPYLGPEWLAGAIPLAALVGLASLHILLRGRQNKAASNDTSRRPRWPTTPNWLTLLTSHPNARRVTGYPGVTTLAVLYLVACPVLVGILAASEDRISIGTIAGPDARWAFLLALVINLLYLGLVVGIAVFNLDLIAVWALKEMSAYWRGRVFNLGRGVSILVWFATFLLLTAETWEIMATLSSPQYLLLLGFLLSLTGAFHLLMTLEALPSRSKFKEWSEVHKTAITDLKASENGNAQVNSDVAYLFSEPLEQVDDKSSVTDYPLNLLEKANIVIVMMIYEIFFFIPVMIGATIIFLVLGYLAVPHSIAANWIYGDRATGEELKQLTQLPLTHQPWLRVAVLLTAFSILFLAVEILSEPAKRSNYFKGPEHAVRQRLAVRLAYYEALKHRALTHRWMARDTYLKLVRSREAPRRFGSDPQGQSGGARDGQPVDIGGASQRAT